MFSIFFKFFLNDIYFFQCESLKNQTAAGPILYQSILQSVYSGTIPVDFVELAGILDIIYITPTSVGLISTKRILFKDRTQPGYARATNLIYCPPSFFGFVGGTCASCSDVTSRGYKASVAWQIQCPMHGMQQKSGISSTFETFSMVTGGGHITEADFFRGICIFSAAKNKSCPSMDAVIMDTPQQFNMAADTQDAAAAGIQMPTTTVSLVSCLIATAENTTETKLFRKNTAEYSARITSQGSNIIAASLQAGILKNANYSLPGDQDIALRCKASMAYGLGAFLKCAVTATTTNDAGGGQRRRRSLLAASDNNAQPQQTMVVEHQGVAVASLTTISWTKNNNNDMTDIHLLRDVNNINNVTTSKNSADQQFPWWLGICIGIVSFLLVFGLFFILYKGRFLKRTPATTTEASWQTVMKTKRRRIDKEEEAKGRGITSSFIYNNI